VKAHVHPGLIEFDPHPALHKFARALLDRAKILYAIRDGRDVLVSLYEYRRKIDVAVAQLSFAEFLRRPFKNAANPALYWASHVEAWVGSGRSLVVPYEAFHSDYAEIVRRIAEFLGLPIREPIFDMVMSRNPNAAHISSAVLFRKGGVGEYGTYFSTSDMAFFDEQAGRGMEIYRQAIQDYVAKSR